MSAGSPSRSMNPSATSSANRPPASTSATSWPVGCHPPRSLVSRTASSSAISTGVSLLGSGVLLGSGDLLGSGVGATSEQWRHPRLHVVGGTGQHGRQVLVAV